MSAESGLIPQTPGPKLGPFRVKDSSTRPDVEFISHIGEGLHSHVLAVSIQGVEYALKVFKFLDPEEYIPPPQWKGEEPEYEQLVYERDPFYCECRAYGRLKETGREDAAVKCHGYIFLNPSEEQAVMQHISEDFDRGDYWYEEDPIRCLVKDFIESEIQYTTKMLPTMMRDLQLINKSGIVVYDVKEDAYVDGKLVDFSQAYTVPNSFLDIKIQDMDLILQLISHDFARFDGMIDSWNNQHPEQHFWSRFLPNMSRRRKLRDGKKFIDDLWYRPPLPRIMLHLYDWENLQMPGERKKRGAKEGTASGPGGTDKGTGSVKKARTTRSGAKGTPVAKGVAKGVTKGRRRKKR